jgi:hypothetical protein
MRPSLLHFVLLHAGFRGASPVIGLPNEILLFRRFGQSSVEFGPDDRPPGRSARKRKA